MKKLIFILILLLIINIVNAQQDSCLFPSPGNAKLIAQRILLTYSQLNLPEGVTPQQAALDSVDRWQSPEEWVAYKEDIKFDIRNFYKDDSRLEKVLRNYIKDPWGEIIQEDIPLILSLSERTGVPAEAILSAILVEDLRYYGPDFSSMLSVSFIKSNLRKTIPNSILTRFGHNPNAAEGYSNYGTVHDPTYNSAKEYLLSLSDLDQGTKDLLSQKNPPIFSAEYFLYQLTIALKAQMEYWEHAGFDIFEYNFKTVDSFGERVGVLETLNSISRYYSEDFYDMEHKVQVTPGFYTGGILDEEKKEVVLTRRIVPSDSPLIGGSKMWGWTDYGTISRVFVDSGLAEKMLIESRNEVALSN